MHIPNHTCANTANKQARTYPKLQKKKHLHQQTKAAHFLPLSWGFRYPRHPQCRRGRGGEQLHATVVSNNRQLVSFRWQQGGVCVASSCALLSRTERRELGRRALKRENLHTAALMVSALCRIEEHPHLKQSHSLSLTRTFKKEERISAAVFPRNTPAVGCVY
jgi:hypothetical protein